MTLLAVAGLALAGLGWLLEPQVFASAWLAVLAVWLGWPLGSLALLLVHRLTGGAWGEALRPALLRGVAGLWLVVPATAPLLASYALVYPWAAGGAGSYLHGPFVAARAALYAATWLVLAAMVLRAERRGGAAAPLAGMGLATLAITMTFASIDLTMSLQPGYTSGAYGLDFIAGAMALAAAIALVACGGAAPAGGLLLGLALLWGYLDFVQFLITAESNLPADASWYAPRLAGGWLVVAACVSALHLVLPVLTLLSRRLRRSPPVLAGLAALLIVAAMLRGWWVVLPAAPRPLSWIDFACVLAFAACSLVLPARRKVAAHG